MLTSDNDIQFTDFQVSFNDAVIRVLYLQSLIVYFHMKTTTAESHQMLVDAYGYVWSRGGLCSKNTIKFYKIIISKSCE